MQVHLMLHLYLFCFGYLSLLTDAKNPCNPNPCDNYGECRPIESSFKCECIQGYGGITCKKILCDPNPCQNDGSCTLNEREEFSCICRLGYTGKECERKIPIDPYASSTAKSSVLTTTTLGTSLPKTTPPGNTGNATVAYTSVADTSYRSNPESTFKSTPNIKPNTKSQNILDTTSEIFEITTVVSTEIDRSTKTPVKSTTTIATTMVDDNEITMEPSTTTTAETSTLATTTRATTFPKTSPPDSTGNTTVAYTSAADTSYRSSPESTLKSTSNINPNTISRNIPDVTSEVFEITAVGSTEMDRSTKTPVKSTTTIATTKEDDNEITMEPSTTTTAETSTLATTTRGTTFPKTSPPDSTGNTTVAYTSAADTSYRSSPESTLKSTSNINPNTISRNIPDVTSEVFEITTVGSTEMDRSTKTPVKSTTTIATTKEDDNEIIMEPSTTSTAESSTLATTTRGTTFPKTSSPRNFGNATVAYTSDADTFYKSSRESTFRNTSSINPNTRSENILDTTSEIFEITTVRSTEIDRRTKTLVEPTVTTATTVEGDNDTKEENSPPKNAANYIVYAAAFFAAVVAIAISGWFIKRQFQRRSHRQYFRDDSISETSGNESLA